MTHKIHMFIVWHQAIPFWPYIIETIESRLDVLDVIHFICSRSRAISIQQKIYDISFEEAQEKCKSHNFEDFIVIIVRLKHDIYITTITHWGTARVEKHMYNIKNTLRKEINIPFCIHSTISEKEAERDILITTGKQISYYSNHALWDKTTKEISL